MKLVSKSLASTEEREYSPWPSQDQSDNSYHTTMDSFCDHHIIDSEPLILGNSRIVNSIEDIEAYIKQVEVEEERNDHSLMMMMHRTLVEEEMICSEEYLSNLMEKNELSHDHFFLLPPRLA